MNSTLIWNFTTQMESCKNFKVQSNKADIYFPFPIKKSSKEKEGILYTTNTSKRALYIHHMPLS